MVFTINDVLFLDACQVMMPSISKLSSYLNKDQFRLIRKYLELFYVEQQNHPQTNNVTEGREEGESMHIYEDYRNRPYHPPTLTLVCIDSFVAGFLSLCLRNSRFNFVERAEVELTLNRPICVGFAILDILKMLMHDSHYNYTKRNYPDSTLLFIDTDSLTY